MHQPDSEIERLRMALAASGTGTWQINIQSGEMFTDELAAEILAISNGFVLDYREAFRQVNPDDLHRLTAAIETTTNGDGQTLDVKCKTLSERIHITGSKTTSSSGEVLLTGTVRNVTVEKTLQNNWLHNEKILSDIIAEAPVATALYMGRELKVAVANSVMLSYWGKDLSIIGLPLEDAVPELEGQPFVEILVSLFDTGGIYQVSEEPVVLATNGVLGTYYFDFTYKPLYNEDGEIYGIMNMAVDVTNNVVFKKKLQASEARFRAITEQSPMAIGLLKGRDMVIEIGNQRIFDLWGKKSAITGMRIIDALPEIKGQPFMDILENVYDTGESFYGYDTLAKLEYNGELKDVYFDFTYSALRDEDGAINGILILASDVTERRYNLQKIANSEAKFRSLIEQAPVATCLFVGRDMVIELANDIMLQYWGKGNGVIGLPLKDGLPELRSQEFLQILDDVYTSGIAHSGTEVPVILELSGIPGTYYFDFTYKPIVDAGGNIYAVMNMAIDVTERVLVRQKVWESQKELIDLFEQSPIGIAIMNGNDLVFSLANSFYGQLVGRNHDELIHKPFLEALPELEGQGYDALLREVLITGAPYISHESGVDIHRNGKLEKIYVNLTFQPRRDVSNAITGVMVVATDVTQQVLSKQRVEASEAKVRSVVDAAPASIVLFSGENFVIDMFNQAFLEFVDRGHEINGKPLLEAIPEIEGQESLRLLREVWLTGKTSHSFGRPVSLVKHGELCLNYYNVTYTPLFDTDGKVYAILDIAIDVTESIMARQAIEKAEASLRGAIELAELGTWNLNPVTGEVTYSERLLQWFGFDADKEDLDDVFDAIHEKDREKIIRATMAAIQPGSAGIYDEEYTVVHKITGRERILHAQGKAFFNADGHAYLLSGTAQDITAQRKIQTALENEVKDRTEELRMANRELEDANRSLINSNEELAQYAYVASHDLQEPLRKISMFSNLLSERDEEKVHKPIIDKILNSSRRMSLLIKDLLEFSRLLNPDVRFMKTDLQAIVAAVEDDFELLIEEKEAILEIDNLPVIDAVPLQMNQLFYNLISNALKFVTQNTQPRVIICYKKLDREEAADYIYNADILTDYCLITVSDNGIGIEEQYTKQIFDVFKRLHGRDEYYGSGIGLAICRRIVNNHNGSISIKSEIGKGTTFYIVLPEKQAAKKVDPSL